jgi:hypothetical protein
VSGHVVLTAGVTAALGIPTGGSDPIASGAMLAPEELGPPDRVPDEPALILVASIP